MELKEFIKTAITDITEAISELQKDLDNGTVINPTISRGEYGKAVLVEQGVAPIEHLNFDVAVTASESSGIGGEAKAGISIFGAKVGTENSSRMENVSRLTFSIPLVYPPTRVKTKEEIAKERHSKRPAYDDV
ncbi:MAG: hypothetical protein NC212_08715 [Staphylococcus sp.]|nr:hypothetical protein [Staphylococcus sp.]